MLPIELPDPGHDRRTIGNGLDAAIVVASTSVIGENGTIAAGTRRLAGDEG